MLIFWKEKLVILAVAKTGTTAFEDELAPHADVAFRNPPRLKHATAHTMRHGFPKLFRPENADSFEQVAVMRDPLDWLGSWYRYRQRSFLDGQPQSTSGLSFEAFVKGYLASPRKSFANIGSQAKFLEPRPNGTIVNHLFRYENLEDAVAFLQSRLGLEISLPQKNVSPYADLTLSKETEAALRAQCSHDFRLWESLG